VDVVFALTRLAAETVTLAAVDSGKAFEEATDVVGVTVSVVSEVGRNALTAESGLAEATVTVAAGDIAD